MYRRQIRIGTITAFGAGHEQVFSGRRRTDKFMRAAPAHQARVCLDYLIRQFTAVKDAAIRLIHLLITLVQRRLVRMKTVGIHHQKFLTPDNPEPGPEFITELGLNLV